LVCTTTRFSLPVVKMNHFAKEIRTKIL